MNRKNILPILQALLAAVLFGASAPLAKLLLGETDPIPLAALLYLGCGLFMLLFRIFKKLILPSQPREAGLQKADYPWMAGSVLAGGLAAPIILMFSLKDTPAATAALLLNFECVATTLIAAVWFKEALGKQVILAVMLITGSTVLLSVNPAAEWGVSLGALGIIVACIFWGLDNNFTRNISARDPEIIVMIKGIAAGSISLGIALLLGMKFPVTVNILKALVLGGLSYGCSIVLFIRAMRGMGAARTSALFSTAPFIGMVLAVFLFKEYPGVLSILAVPVMIAGTILIVSEDHAHVHTHPAVEHEHIHTHDDGHHNHIHAEEIHGPHSHLHTHEELVHAHPHLPDIHHRHIHPSSDHNYTH